jgi:hypothetical protein
MCMYVYAQTCHFFEIQVYVKPYETMWMVLTIAECNLCCFRLHTIAFIWQRNNNDFKLLISVLELQNTSTLTTSWLPRPSALDVAACRKPELTDKASIMWQRRRPHAVEQTRVCLKRAMVRSPLRS